ncbi:GNAT family N-acetyltransferase [filamentous cyanobacterium CCP5]|nr:GNAT family N-acetyltransferase [filamentous cyanobacterium CCP5]
MERTYREIYPQQTSRHLAYTVDAHLSPDTPLWWAETPALSAPIGGLWLGNALDQVSGQRHAYVLLLYVAPDYRRRGIATTLLEAAHQWAQQRGDRQISLQVFHDNQPALSLYQKLGYRPSVVMLSKSLGSSNP